MSRISNAFAAGLVLLSVFGCQKWQEGGHVRGIRAYYTIEGKVVDKAGNPVPDKEIVLAGLKYDTPDVDYDYNVWPFDTLRTAADGCYAFEGYSESFNGIRVTTLENFDETSEGCTPPNGIVFGMPVIPLEWKGIYSEVSHLEFKDASEGLDDECYLFTGFTTVQMPELIIEN